MKIDVNKNSAIKEPMDIPTDKRCNSVYCPELDMWWPSGQKCAEEIGVTPVAIYLACNGGINTCKGMHFCYEKDVARYRTIVRQHITGINDENAKLKAELEAEREIANQWRAYQAQIAAEEEAKRKAEQEHLELIEHTKQAIENAKAEQERLKRIRETYEEQLQRVESDLMNAEHQEYELIDKLLELEGKVKED